MYEPCAYMKISVTYRNEHVAESPYVTNNMVYSDDCMCPINNINDLIESWECGLLPTEITEKLKIFREINWNQYREKVKSVCILLFFFVNSFIETVRLPIILR